MGEEDVNVGLEAKATVINMQRRRGRDGQGGLWRDFRWLVGDDRWKKWRRGDKAWVRRHGWIDGERGRLVGAENAVIIAVRRLGAGEEDDVIG